MPVVNFVSASSMGMSSLTIKLTSSSSPFLSTVPQTRTTASLTAPVTTLAYDSNGRLVTLTNPDASTQTFTYNTADQILTVVDELSKTTTLVYDSLGRQTSVTNRVSAVTQTAYDAMSRVIKQTDALGNVIDTEYNNRGWISKTISPDPDGSGSLTRPEASWYYDGVGNLTSEGEPDSYYTSSIPYTYDGDNRKQSRGTSANYDAHEEWRYDNAGRLVSIFRAATFNGTDQDQTALEYDAVGRVVRQRVRTTPGYYQTAMTFAETTFGYSLAGELISQTDGRGNTESMAYNSRGLLFAETLPDPDGVGSQFGLVITHGYDNMGRETSVDRGLGRVSTLEYNSRSWVTKLTDRKSVV